MSSAALKRSDPGPSGLPVAPSAERWRAMTEAERERFLDESLAALQRVAELSPEGAPHSEPKVRIRELLRDYFAREGRAVYLKSDLPVHYPDEDVFAPDLLAVLGVEDPGLDDERNAWVVAQEGKGLDLVLEVTWRGDRQKDLASNVVTYARMRIPEYFIYDRLKQRVLGYRLPYPTATRYDPIPARGGLVRSQVLGLELGVLDGRVRFFHGGGQIPETAELLARANLLLEKVEARAEAEAQRAEAEAQRAEGEAAARAALERKVAELLAKLGEAPSTGTN